MKSCAIVILNFNGEKVLSQCLPSVVKHSSSDIWVIDNCSTDGSLLLLKENFSRVKIITLESNFGFAGGYNWGLSQIEDQYEYYILLNSDVEVTPDWDTALVQHFSLHSDLAAIQPKILSYANRQLFDYAGAGGGFLDGFGYPYCRGRIWNSIEEDKGQYDDSIEVDWASGACMVIRAKVFHELSGFDGHFFAHMEEIDLCWRMRLSGWRIGYFGQVKIYHMGGATLERSNPQKLYLNIRNSLTMLYKNSSGPDFLVIFLFKILLESGAALGYIIKDEFGLAKSIYNGYKDFIITKKQFEKVKGSSDNQAKSKGPAQNIFWKYFILRKKIFSEI